MQALQVAKELLAVIYTVSKQVPGLESTHQTVGAHGYLLIRASRSRNRPSHPELRFRAALRTLPKAKPHTAPEPSTRVIRYL